MYLYSYSSHPFKNSNIYKTGLNVLNDKNRPQRNFIKALSSKLGGQQFSKRGFEDTLSHAENAGLCPWGRERWLLNDTVFLFVYFFDFFLHLSALPLQMLTLTDARSDRHATAAGKGLWYVCLTCLVIMLAWPYRKWGMTVYIDMLTGSTAMNNKPSHPAFILFMLS